MISVSNYMERTSADIYLSYDITLSCNMRCEYCYQLPHLNNDLVENKVIAAMFLVKLKKVLKNNPDKSIEVDLLGGEPMLYPGISEYLNKLLNIRKTYNNLKVITVTTNGSYVPDDFPKDDIHINVTYHNFLPDVQIFKSNLVLLENYSDLMSVTINLYAKKINLEEIKDVLNFCNKIGIHTIPIDVHDGHDTMKFIDKETRETISSLTTLDDTEFYTYDGHTITMHEIREKNMWSGVDRRCNMASFHTCFDGSITASCNYELGDMNIMTHDINPRLIFCSGNISCQGGAAMKNEKWSVEEYGKTH